MYEVSFAIECRAPRLNDCPLDDNTRTARFRFSLRSSSFCVEVVDAIGLTASMNAFADAAFQVPKDDFLDTQTVFWRLAVSSNKAALRESMLWNLRAEKSQVGSASIVQSWELVREGRVQSGAGVAMGVVATPGGAAVPGAESVMSVRMVLSTAAAVFDIPQDEIAQVRFVATVRVAYLNAGQAPLVQSVEGEEVVEHRVWELALIGTSSAVATGVVSVVGGEEGVSEKGGAGMGKETGTGVASGVFAAVVACGVALVVVAAAVGVRRMREKALAREQGVLGELHERGSGGMGEGEEVVGSTSSTALVTGVMAVSANTTMGEVMAAYVVEDEGV